jgi:hypothetical protein
MIDLSHETFFIFGCGDRPKLICTDHGLIRWPGSETVVEFSAHKLSIDPSSYEVAIDTTADTHLVIGEDERGIWLTQDGKRTCLAGSAVALPTFENHPQRDLLRVLHHEILVNVVDGKPVPNLFVYDRPWYRDAAMVAMVLEKTGNTNLMRDWIVSLRDPFDRNNGGQEEPDNLGQVLYLISLVSDASHPIVQTVLDSAGRITTDGHLNGQTDWREHPVYQTKWLKFGLERLGLADDFVVPQVEDSYAPLFWWDKDDITLPSGKRYHDQAELFPYLAWAEAHFWGDSPPMHLAANDYPVTWESHASQADYGGTLMIDEGFAERKLCMPHTWHAAEMFLYLLEIG